MKPYFIAAVFIAVLLYFILNKNNPLTKAVNKATCNKWKFLEGQQIIRNDSAGLGHFGASRGTRTHKGIDLLVTPGESIRAPFSGTVRTLYVYAGYNLLEGVEITSDESLDVSCKIFYMKPSVSTGDRVECGQLIGLAQNVKIRYPNSPAMRPHIHVERRESGTAVNPANYIHNLFIPV